MRTCRRAGPVRDVPVDWEALEDAFENNAPEVHSYLHLTTGEVLRVVDGVADPQMHVRIASDGNYLRIDPVSSREQYRWMERFIPMVDDTDLRGQAHPGHRRQGRVPPLQGRAHVLRARSASAGSHSAASVSGPSWRPGSARTPSRPSPGPLGATCPPARRARSRPTPPGPTRRPSRRTAGGRETRRRCAQHMREMAEALGPRDLDMMVGVRRVPEGAARRTRLRPSPRTHAAGTVRRGHPAFFEE